MNLAEFKKEIKDLNELKKSTLASQDDSMEKKEMAQTQLHFIGYAAKEILEYIDMGGEIEEWYQNKLSKVQSEVESLHSYIEGEKRRTGMVKEEKEEVEQVDENQGDKEHKAYIKTMAAFRLKQTKKSGRKRSQDWYNKQVKMKNEEVEQINEMDKSQPAAGRDSDTPYPTKPVKVTDKQRASAKLMTKELLKHAKKQLKNEEVEQISEGGPTRKHFQQVADLIKANPNPELRTALAKHHANIFKNQNPRFDHKRFYEKAGVEVNESSVEPGSNAVDAEKKTLMRVGNKNFSPIERSRIMAALRSKNPTRQQSQALMNYYRKKDSLSKDSSNQATYLRNLRK